MTAAMEIERRDSSESSVCHNKLGNALLFWIRECAWPGLGLFGESYLLFSIGTLTPLWELLFEDCFVNYKSCNPSLRHSLTYTVVLGVICGMMLLGTLANTLGRRMGSILTATFMCGGAWGMTLCSLILVNDASLLFKCMVALLFLFGVGVGGEYPLSASSASERAMAELQAKQQQQEEEETFKETVVEFDYNAVQENLSSSSNDNDEIMQSPPPARQHNHRGRRVQLVFTMQGMGIMFNCILMTLLLLFMGQSGNAGELQNDDASVSGYYSASRLLAIWRITYAIGAAVLSYVLVSRILYLQESQVWQHDKERREQQKQHVVTNGSVEQPPPPQQQQQYQAPELEMDDINQRSVQSEVSSLSAPSVQVNDETSLRDVPSTTSEEDLKSSGM